MRRFALGEAEFPLINKGGVVMIPKSKEDKKNISMDYVIVDGPGYCDLMFAIKSGEKLDFTIKKSPAPSKKIVKKCKILKVLFIEPNRNLDIVLIGDFSDIGRMRAHYSSGARKGRMEYYDILDERDEKLETENKLNQILALGAKIGRLTPHCIKIDLANAGKGIVFSISTKPREDGDNVALSILRAISIELLNAGIKHKTSVSELRAQSKTKNTMDTIEIPLTKEVQLVF